MKCETCGIAMLLVRLTEQGPVYRCRNPRCTEHGKEKTK